MRPNHPNQHVRFDIYDRILYSSIWTLDEEEQTFLDDLFYRHTTADKFISRIELPDYKAGKFLAKYPYGPTNFFVNYINCSLDLIFYWQQKGDSRKLDLQFRYNRINSFFSCLVRPARIESHQTEDR